MVQESDQGTPDFGSHYAGEWKFNTWIRQGLGELVRKNGLSYNGYFKDSKFDGKGELTFAKDDKEGRQSYIGTFKDGVFDGYGLLSYTNGDKLSIGWDNGNINGQGIYTWENGTRARVTTKANQPLFDLPLIFPPDDYR